MADMSKTSVQDTLKEDILEHNRKRIHGLHLIIRRESASQATYWTMKYLVSKCPRGIVLICIDLSTLLRELCG